MLNQKAKRIRVQQLRKCNSFPIASYEDKCHFAGDNLNKDHVSKLEIYDQDPSFFKAKILQSLVVHNALVSEDFRQCLSFQFSFVY